MPRTSPGSTAQRQQAAEVGVALEGAADVDDLVGGGGAEGGAGQVAELALELLLLRGKVAGGDGHIDGAADLSAVLQTHLDG